MLKEIANVIKTAKLKHINRALVSPSDSIKALKYHYRRVTQRDFVTFIAKQWRCSQDVLNKLYSDFEGNTRLWEETKRELSLYPNNYGLQMTKELSTLYLAVRLVELDHIVETGVSAGVSSTYILSALEDNKKGELHSIDLPPENLPAGKTVGWIVPEHLRDYWSLHIGDSKELLKPLLQEIGEINCFIHDSLHTYENMMWEFRTAWKYICPNGLFLSHDFGVNEAFFDFMKEKGIPWSSYRVFHVLGGFQKP